MIRISPLKILPLLLPISFLVVCAVLWIPHSNHLINNIYLNTFKSRFMGILLEALPFVLAGSLLSSFLNVYVPDSLITRWIPRAPLPAILLGCLLGIIFSVCECGMIPLVRRLLRKGMPLHVAVAFILSGPILNPVVYSATFTAFRTRSEIAYSRMALAFAVSICIGLLVWATVRESPLRLSIRNGTSDAHVTRGGKFAALFVHAADEFFEMGKYLITGCLLTACIQTFMSSDSLATIGNKPVGSYLFMMGLAFILSLCSTSDAFVASTFVHSFPAGALLAFMVFGPMLDFKNALMLLSLFKTKFAILLFFLIFCTVFIGSVLIGKVLL
ncbi:permease [Paenibacillus donghaensis]|uniref:Permease n=1 Tax=Paenibacillus donghaensis TaxID=414771 RepID=A0A2Z2KB32_9BACL|nr:permease [Paenibacillus donghaensis]ASA20170.1 hypothetical protein B9T62_04765 [Paenibacillus donghaensis]